MPVALNVVRRFARRSSWLARRLWIIALADVALLTRRHWKRLEPEERRRLGELMRKAKLRPSKNLSARERREASELLDKMGYAELAGGAVKRFVPLPLVGRTTEHVVRRTNR
jgi:hypothetical protein